VCTPGPTYPAAAGPTYPTATDPAGPTYPGLEGLLCFIT